MQSAFEDLMQREAKAPPPVGGGGGGGFVRPENQKDRSLAPVYFLPLNDEHQGEGGTLMFVGFYITTLNVTKQGLLH
jgi:hypothetical protein